MHHLSQRRRMSLSLCRPRVSRPTNRLRKRTPACAPDSADFAEVASTHWPQVFRFVLRSVRDVDLAEDLTQECFEKAWKGWQQFRGDASVNTWLRHIAVNVISNHGRKRGFHAWHAVSVDPTGIEEWLIDANRSPESNAIMQERLQAIWEAVQFVPPKQRAVFRLRFAEDMDVHDIASAMGITEGAVKVHLFRAVHTVRKKLHFRRKR
jgi:RNA polymerase sigma-70 factor, ECF subfamily